LNHRQSIRFLAVSELLSFPMNPAPKTSVKRLAKFWLAGLGLHNNAYSLEIAWVKKDRNSWLSSTFGNTVFRPPMTPAFLKIETQAEWTQSLGSKSLWTGYGDEGAVRDSDAVRTAPAIGTLYSWLVMRRRPNVVVEFGGAFGISGMYWLAGLEKTANGRLYSYEPNSAWADIALQNLSAIGTRFTLTNGTFEENVDRTLMKQKVDIALIDAIHTSEFVDPQYVILAERMARPGLVLFDDIDFSDDMRECWQRLATSDQVRASLEVRSHLGIIELA
jgi:predicted O-methyltransferase YrrM